VAPGPGQARAQFVSQLFVNDLAQTETADPGPERSPLPTLEAYWRALGLIGSSYFNPDLTQQPSATSLTYAGIRGVLSSLDDPYTRFLSPEQYNEMINENRGTFPGIGVELKSSTDGVMIDIVLPNSPASAAPLKPGDIVLKVDDTSVAGMSTAAVGTLLKGKEGTRLRLVVRRGRRIQTFNLTRREVTYLHFESRMVQGHIGYMHLMMFDQQAGDDIAKALRQFHASGAKGLVLDLRDNPGGLLNSAVDVASYFIPQGPVVWVQERGGQRNSLLTNEDPATRNKLPLVVLVNHYSASASEIVSGAIKDTKAGTLIGLTTWGKGLVQEVMPLNDNSAIALTTAHYFTPNGSDINLKGVTPDIVVGHIVPEPSGTSAASSEAYDAETAQVDSEQLATALQILREKIRAAKSQTVALRH
jgi:carboxyl-terminal processing protease